MSNLVQNQNQTFQTAMLAQVTRGPQPNTFPAQINPASGYAGPWVAGMALKLIAAVGPNIIVDAITGPTDGPVFGVIPYNKRKNIYAVGDIIEVVGDGGVLLMKCAAGVNRATRVTITNPAVLTNDPQIQTTVTTGQQATGVALGQGVAGDLIEVRIAPFLIP